MGNIWRAGLSVTILALAACSGGGGGGGGGGQSGKPAVSFDSIRDLTGTTAPVESPAAQKARAPAILSRADSLILSTVHAETNIPEVPTLRLQARCAGAQCLISDTTIGYSQTVSLSDLITVDGPTDAVGTKHGITLMYQTASTTSTDYTTLGAWMQHGAFASMNIEKGTAQVQDFAVDFTGRLAIAGGDLTGTRPTGNATWLGLMVGTPATGSNRGDRLMGDAALNYDMNAGGLDVAFSSIKNIDRGAAHSTPTVTFTDVPISTRGTFEAGFVGNRIQGGFYGPAHIEAAGIFEQSNIIGAFGARRYEE